eukprot:4681305-Pyramimonas_sp.AAC.1
MQMLEHGNRGGVRAIGLVKFTLKLGEIHRRCVKVHSRAQEGEELLAEVERLRGAAETKTAERAGLEEQATAGRAEVAALKEQ